MYHLPEFAGPRRKMLLFSELPYRLNKEKWKALPKKRAEKDIFSVYAKFRFNLSHIVSLYG